MEAPMSKSDMSFNHMEVVNAIKESVRNDHLYVNGTVDLTTKNVLIALMSQIQDILQVLVKELILLVVGNQTKKYIPQIIVY